MKTATTLLQDVKQAAGCPFLSDLHSTQWFRTPQAQAAVMAIQTDQYSLEAWNEAVSYVLKKNCTFSTAEEAKIAILQRK